jgi:uncharacterized membrane protein
VTWPQLLGLAAISYALKALGVLVLGSAPPKGRAADAVRLLPAALLAALVAVQTFSDGDQLMVDARAAGIAFAAVAVWRRWPFTVVVIGAAAVTALVRLVT